MPELPEVETVVNGLREKIVGKEIERVKINAETMLKKVSSKGFSSLLMGSIIKNVKRRAKFILLLLEKNHEQFTLAIHLRMTGSLVFLPQVPIEEKPYTRAIFSFSNNEGLLVFKDIRKFGTMEILDGVSKEKFDSKLGVEPLSEEFTVKALKRLAKGKKAPVKSFLLNQRYICGIGNIYADEILFRSCVHPQKPLSKLTDKELQCIWENIPLILKEGIKAGGTTTRDYRNAGGEAGSFQNLLKVYQKAGDECPRCQEAIHKIKVAGRGSYYCPGCQNK